MEKRMSLYKYVVKRWVQMLAIMLISLLFAIVLVGIFLLQNKNTVRVYSFENANYFNISQIKLALLKYCSDNDHFPSISTCNDAFSGVSWRVLLLPYFGKEILYDQVMSNTIDSSELCRDVNQMPEYYHWYGNNDSRVSLTSATFILIPSSEPTKQPTVVMVRRANFCWIEDGDACLSKLISEMDANKKLYDITSAEISLCNIDDKVVILAPDGEIYFLPTSTSVDTFKKIIDTDKIKRLNKKRKGIFTYFY
jgi:hypothetical protein